MYTMPHQVETTNKKKTMFKKKQMGNPIHKK